MVRCCAASEGVSTVQLTERGRVHTIAERPEQHSREVKRSKERFQEVHVDGGDPPALSRDAACRKHRAGKPREARARLARGCDGPASNTAAAREGPEDRVGVGDDCSTDDGECKIQKFQRILL